MKTIVNRLKEYLDYKSISVSVAEKEINISNASLSKPFKNNTSIKTDTLEKFLITYPEISPEWLLTGKGSMLNEDSTPDNINYKDLADARLEIIEMLKEKVSKLNNDVIELTSSKGNGSSVQRGAVEFLNEPQLGGISGKKG